MSKKKDLEEIFIEELHKHKIGHFGKAFNMGNDVILADYIFGTTMVFFMDRVVKSRIDKMIKFAQKFSKHELVLVTKNCKSFLGQTWFTEMYDGDGMTDLIKKIKRIDRENNRL